MTTNSITKNIRIEDKDEAKRLVTALEIALERKRMNKMLRLITCLRGGD